MPQLETFQSFIDSLSNANVKKIFGDPVSAEGRTIIPVAKVAYGFGGGFGGSGGSSPQEGNGQSAETHAREQSERGGGALAAMPLGVIEITKEETRYVPANDTRKLLGVLALGMLIGLVMRR